MKIRQLKRYIKKLGYLNFYENIRTTSKFTRSNVKKFPHVKYAKQIYKQERYKF